jgi:pimeloyl-ACP methyl ester carboxylesterase
MTPLLFGAGERRLFGLYTPRHATGGRERAVVLCAPWGQEYLRSHRAMRQLGSMLAAGGFHVLRFDYFGTGDSAGEPTEADLKGLEADIDTAIEELKDTTGLNRISLVGLRLGATLAARVAARRRKEVEALVLWDPVVSGDEYLAELHSADEGAIARPQACGGGLEILGFPLTSAFSRELQTINLMTQVPALPPRSFVAISQALSSHDALRPALQAAATPIALETIASLPAWLKDHDLGDGAVPVNVLRRITEWMV